MITNHGQAFYLLSSSEFAQVSLSARVFIAPQCRINPVDGSRPPPPTPDVAEGPTPEDKPEDSGEAEAPVEKETADNR